MRRLVPYGAAALLLAALVASLHSQPATGVESLRVQKVGGTTYFHVRLSEPPGLIRTAPGGERRFMRSDDGADPALAPRLVSADGKVRLIAARVGNRFDARRFDKEFDDEPKKEGRIDKDKSKEDGIKDAPPKDASPKVMTIVES